MSKNAILIQWLMFPKAKTKHNYFVNLPNFKEYFSVVYVPDKRKETKNRLCTVKNSNLDLLHLFLQNVDKGLLFSITQDGTSAASSCLMAPFQVVDEGHPGDVEGGGGCFVGIALVLHQVGGSH